MYMNDLMMAVTVGATAFIGLTPILFKQIADSGLVRCLKIALLALLTITIPLGVGAVFMSAGWLEIQGDCRLIMAQKLFTWQVTISSVTAIVLFISRCIEEYGKRTARSRR
jgi:hypothetical protein